MLTNYFSRRSHIRLEERKLKEEYFTFIKALSENVTQGNNDTKVMELRRMRKTDSFGWEVQTWLAA